MPIYEFSCRSCGLFEVQRSVREATTSVPCPSCHASASRVLSAPVLMPTSRAAQRQRTSGTPPQVVQRRAPETPPASPAPQYQRSGRPWHLSH
ncbi:MAG: zinc ribbon domain-containing protein [Deltaproteobacteria bacterium]|nr:zinc ribbon domain-containing protein [Deltaproteobacteria bacterium]